MLVFLAGCAHYEAKPLQPAETLEQLSERRLTDPRVIERVHTVVGTPISAETGYRWNRAELLVAALELSPALGEARAQLEQSTASVRTAHALQDPTLSLSSEYDVSRSDEPTWLWGIGTSFLLDTFVSRGLRTSIAQAGVRGAYADFSDAMWTLRKDVRLALLSAVVSARRIDLLQKDLQQREELSRLTRQRIDVGEGARPEGLQADLEVARARASLEEARRTQMDARAKLAAALGVPARSLEDVTLAWDVLDTPGPLSEETLRASRDRALLSRADLERAIADYTARDLELRQQVSAQYLQVSLGPGYTYDHGVRKVTFGASVALPVFNRNQGPIAEAYAAREAAGQHALVVQSTILNEVDSASAAYSAALAALERARAQREASDALAASARRAFDIDASDRPTLLAAEVAATTERLAELDALERAQQALGQLEDAVRAPLVGPEVNLSPLESP
jgi:outer membrane protein TolC